MPILRLFAVTLALLAGCACSSIADRVRDDPQSLTLVILHAAVPPPALSREESSAAMAGHFSNMKALSEQGKLLLAGPFGPPRSEATHRGIFVLDTPDVDAARAWTATDPAVQAGVFTVEALPLRTRSAMRDIVSLDRAAIARRIAEDPTLTPDTAWVGRAYVLASAPRTEANLALASRLQARSAALLAFEVERDAAVELWLVLDAADVDGARAHLGEAAPGWVMHGWYGTGVLTELPGENR